MCKKCGHGMNEHDWNLYGSYILCFADVRNEKYDKIDCRCRTAREEYTR